MATALAGWLTPAAWATAEATLAGAGASCTLCHTSRAARLTLCASQMHSGMRCPTAWEGCRSGSCRAAACMCWEAPGQWRGGLSAAQSTCCRNVPVHYCRRRIVIAATGRPEPEPAE